MPIRPPPTPWPHAPAFSLLRPALPLSTRPPTTHPFHTTRNTQADNPPPSSHYETLSLPAHSTPAEIKKQFYTLSKSHHPDLHPHDPHASERFVKISEAYAVLGSPEKRARYDRDLARSAPQNFGGRGRGDAPARGSYSSGQAGGRPASGLSRRRTQFRGPPPSFYASGGWGAQGEKRAEYASHPSHAADSHSASAAGTGPGGFAAGFDGDVRHFDHTAHTATHSEIERTRHRARRRRVVREDELEDAGRGRGGGAVGGFLAVCGVLAAAVGLPVGVGVVMRGGGGKGGEG